MYSGTGDSLVMTRDLEEAREFVSSVYAPHKLVSRDAQPLDFRLRYVDVQTMTIGHVQYGAETEAVVPPPTSSYHVNIPLQGTTQVTQGGQTRAARQRESAAILDPDEPFTVRWSPDAAQCVLKVPRETMEDHLAGLFGRPVEEALRFDLDFSLNTPRGQSLVASVEHLCGELFRDGGTAELPLARAKLESYVLTQLLLVVPHNHLDKIDQPRDRALRRHVKEAIEFIQSHASQPISGPDIAKAACVSMRALQTGFREELGVSPMAYLRDVRLARVHAELLSDTDDTSVSEVANKWGFPHLGRFAEQYRRKYGVRPSATLRQRG